MDTTEEEALIRQKDRNPEGVMSSKYLLAGHMAKGEGGKPSCLILRDIMRWLKQTQCCQKGTI